MCVSGPKLSLLSILYVDLCLCTVFFFVDTEKFYTEVQEKILARYNKTFDWSLKAKMMGRKAIEAATLFVEECGISDSLSPEAFIVERVSMLQDLFPTSDLMPGNKNPLLVYVDYY